MLLYLLTAVSSAVFGFFACAVLVAGKVEDLRYENLMLRDQLNGGDGL